MLDAAPASRAATSRYANGREIYCVEDRCRGEGRRGLPHGRPLARGVGRRARAAAAVLREGAASTTRSTHVADELEATERQLRARKQAARAVSRRRATSRRGHRRAERRRCTEGARPRRARRARSTPRCSITGESGVGKERVARLIHDESARARRARSSRSTAARCRRPCSRASCSGTRKGAFTGATQDRPGLFEAANGGTLFLDEIGEVAAGDAGEAPARAAGARGPPRRREHERARSTCACSRRPTATSPTRSRAGRFREDLYYRLARHRARGAAAARAPRRHPAARARPRSPRRRRARRSKVTASRREAADQLAALRLAGQRARARERDRARGRARDRRHASRSTICPERSARRRDRRGCRAISARSRTSSGTTSSRCSRPRTAIAPGRGAPRHRAGDAVPQARRVRRHEPVNRGLRSPGMRQRCRRGRWSADRNDSRKIARLPRFSLEARKANQALVGTTPPRSARRRRRSRWPGCWRKSPGSCRSPARPNCTGWTKTWAPPWWTWVRWTCCRSSKRCRASPSKVSAIPRTSRHGWVVELTCDGCNAGGAAPATPAASHRPRAEESETP